MENFAWTMLVLQYLGTLATASLLRRGVVSINLPRVLSADVTGTNLHITLQSPTKLSVVSIKDRKIILAIQLVVCVWGTVALAFR